MTVKGRRMDTAGTERLVRVAAMAAMAGLVVLAGCAMKLEQPIQGYACCNLHSGTGWISSENPLEPGRFVQAGAPASITSIKRNYYAYGVLDGQSLGLRDNASHGEEDTIAWLHRIVVAEDPKPRIATWPKDVRDAVRAGQVVTGMTRDQAIVALGYPAQSRTHDIRLPVWHYLMPGLHAVVDLVWEGDRLVRVEGIPPAVDAVLFHR